MNSYVKFREGLNKVIKLEQFMSYFDSRQNGCCSADTSASQQKLSGYFDGQWRLLDSSPGLQAALAKDEDRDKSGNKNGRDPAESFRRMQWFTNYFGHDKLSEDYKKWQLGKLGQDFVTRGFAQGKANFALQFDEVIQDNGMSNQIIENIQTQYHNDQQMGAENPLKDGDEKAKALAAANLKKNIVIAQFLNQDFSSQHYRNQNYIKNEIEGKLEEKLFGPKQSEAMGLFDYITDDYNTRKVQLDRKISQEVISKVLEEKMKVEKAGGHLKVNNVSIDGVVKALQQGKLNKGEMMHFINKLRNRATYIKGNLFANDQNSDEQLQIEISLNSKYDGFNTSKDIEFFEYNANTIRSNKLNKTPGMADGQHENENVVISQIKMNNVRVRLMRIKNFWDKETRYCSINMTLDTLLDAKRDQSGPHGADYQMKNPFKNSVLLTTDDAQLLQVRLLLESAEEESDCFPKRIQVDLKSRNIIKTQTKTVYFTIALLCILIVGMGTCLTQLKRILTNYQAAQQLSLFSLAILVVWHFCLFWQHFVFVNIGACFDFLKFPGCAYFLHSFVFEMRLLQEAFKVHYQYLMMDPQALKRKLLVFYLGIYLGFIIFFIYQDVFLYDTQILLVSSGALWVPQIYHNYKRNCINHHPQMSFYLSQTASQVFLIVYMYGCPQNFFEKETDFTFVVLFIGCLLCQLIILYY